jgi:hypothetical protein
VEVVEEKLQNYHLSLVETLGLCVKLVFLKAKEVQVIQEVEMKRKQNIKGIGNVVDVVKRLQNYLSSLETQATSFV